MLKLRDYQKRIGKEAASLLKNRKIAYLCCEVRTGKTLMALEACKVFEAKKVLFVSKKKALSSIQWDYDNFGFEYFFKITIINTESLHKILDLDFDVVVSDEHHKYASFPKPSVGAKEFKKRFGNLPMIFLSGTPTPESHSQWYHQFWVSDHSPFEEANFYKWANNYVDVKLKYLGYAQVKDYSDADRKKIMGVIRHYLIKFTQAEAGFTTSVKEMILFCDMKPITYSIIKRLNKDFIVKNKSGDVIMADTGAKLAQKTHQLFSGTVKFEDGTSKVIDYSKAEYIRDNFKDKKIAIFYKFVAELDALKTILGDLLTTDMAEFKSTYKWIAYQIVSGSQGTSFKEADFLVYFNIDFSALQYWQSRDRLTTMDRKENNVFWIFAKGGIEEGIYKRVLAKKDYTSAIFKKEMEAKYHITKMASGSRKFINQ